MEKHILVKTSTSLTFTGVLQDKHYLYVDKEYIVIKPSEESEIMVMIPYAEVTKVYTMDGEAFDYV